METKSPRPKTKLWLLVVLIWAIGAAGCILVIVSHLSRSARISERVGEEYRDEELKLSFRPPADWVHTPAQPEVIAQFTRTPPLLAAQFEGPRPGDRCVLLVIDSARSLGEIERTMMASAVDSSVDVIWSDYFRQKDSVPAWGADWIVTGEGATARQFYCVFQRGTQQQIVLTYGASKTSYRDQQAAIEASLKSLSLW